MSDQQRPELTGIDIDGDGVIDQWIARATPMLQRMEGALSSQLDPMTPTQMEASRRMVADASIPNISGNVAGAVGPVVGQFINGALDVGDGMRVAAGMQPNPGRGVEGMSSGQLFDRAADTFVPGYQNITEGYGAPGQPSNPMQMAKGGVQAAMAPLLFGRAPMTGMGGTIVANEIDDTIPLAQAAQGMPIPDRNPGRLPEPKPQMQEQQDPSTWQTFVDQAGRNISQLGNTLSGVYDDAVNLFSDGGEFEPPSFDEWAASKRQRTLDQIEKDKKVSDSNVKDVRGPRANQIRKRAAQRAAAAEAGLQQDYRAYVEREKANYEKRMNSRFAERYPSISTAGKVIPAVAAGLTYRGAMRRNARDTRELTNRIQSGKSTNIDMDRDTLAAMRSSRPSALPHLSGGIAGTMVAKAGEDIVDMTVLPSDSQARQQARLSYFPFDDQGNFDGSGLADTMAGYGGRAALVAGTVGVGGWRGGNALSRRQAIEADEAAGIPNVLAARARADANNKMSRLRMDQLEQDSAEAIHKAGANKFRNTLVNDINRMRNPRVPTQPQPNPIGPPPSSAGSLPPPQRPTPGATQGTNPGGQGAAGSHNPAGQTGASPVQGRDSNSRPRGGVAGKALIRPIKVQLAEAFQQNGGKLSQKQAELIAKQVSPDKVKEFLSNLRDFNKKYKMSPDLILQAVKDGKIASLAVGTVGGAAAYNMLGDDFE